MEQYSSKSIIQKAIERLAISTRRREDDLWELMRKFILTLDARKGLLTASNDNIKALADFEALFLEWLVKSGFKKDITRHLKTTTAIQKNIVTFHRDANDINVSKKITTDAKRVLSLRVARDLLGSGITANVTKDLQDILFSAVQGGGSLSDVLNAVRDRSLSTDDNNGLLSRYTTQISRDLLNGYSGALHDEVRAKHGLDAYIYVNSIVKNTRPQCKRWRKKRILLLSELDEEIQWAFRNGSGMIKGTNKFNFGRYRGGYSCRHEALPTRSQK